MMIVCADLAVLASVSTNVVLSHKEVHPVWIKGKDFGDLSTSAWRACIGILDTKLGRCCCVHGQYTLVECFSGQIVFRFCSSHHSIEVACYYVSRTPHTNAF